MASRVWDRCRICGNPHLGTVVDLGCQPLSGVFIKPDAADPFSSPLDLVRCDRRRTPDACGTVQLRHSADIAHMYGTTYGYVSSISPTMVAHLSGKARSLVELTNPKAGDVVLDIGCNDGTLLNAFGADTPLTRIGIDPSSRRFLDRFQPGIKVACEFFSAEAFRRLAGDRDCTIVTSIAMFYDLDDPLAFMRDVRSILARDGVWEVELSYLPALMEQMTYDQICHEHVTYLGLRQMEWMMGRSGLKLIDAAVNDSNGGSFCLRVTRDDSPHQPRQAAIEALRSAESSLDDDAPYDRFRNRVLNQRDELLRFIEMVKAAGRTIHGYGASTKGNVVLNYCGIGPADLPMICDRNPEKHGMVTPGTRIPIVAQSVVRDLSPDYLLVLVWPFRSEVIRDEIDFLRRGGKLVFALPRLHVVDATNYDRYLARPFQDLAYSL